MEEILMAVAALAGAVAGWFIPAVQHHLYTEEEYRRQPARGRRLWLLRAFFIVSAAMALALAFRPNHYDAGPALLTAAFLLVLITLSSTDFERRRIPNKLTYPAAAAAIAFCWAWPDRSIADIALGAGVAAGVAIFLVGLGVFLGGSSMGLGIGDGKLIILLGFLLGWPALMPALFYGILAAGLVAVALLVRKGRGATFSYGPYLAGGGALLLLFPSLA